MSSIDSKYCVMSGVNLGMRLSVSGGSGVSSVGFQIWVSVSGDINFGLNVSVGQEKRSSVRCRNYPLHGPYFFPHTLSTSPPKVWKTPPTIPKSSCDPPFNHPFTPLPLSYPSSTLLPPSSKGYHTPHLGQCLGLLSAT